MFGHGLMAGADATNVSRLWTECPWSDEVTDYDRAHLVTYAWLLDHHSEGASLDDIARFVFDIDPVRHCDRAHVVVVSHLDRALWMTRHGYGLLLW